MSKEKQILEAEEAEVAPVRKNEEKMESFVEETPAIVDATKKRKSNASVPVDKFDWDAFEKDADYGDGNVCEQRFGNG